MKDKQRILILGGSGFIGKNLVEQLSNKYSLIYPTHRELNLLDRKLVCNFFLENKVDIVIYSVNIGGTRNNPSPPNMLRDNLIMFFNVIYNKKYFKRMIFLGSGAEYDKRKKLINVKEKDFGKSIPIDDYGLYKYICSEYISLSEKKIVSLRIFGLFGKYEDCTIRFISNAICRTIFNLPITINENIFFDYIFIQDFIKIIDYFLTHKPKHKFYNIGTGKPIDLVTIANKINKISVNKQKIIIKKKRLGKEYSCNNTLLLKENKFIFSPIDDSLKSLYNYYLGKKGIINKKILLEDHSMILH